MIRKLLLVAAAAAMPLGLATAVSGTAGAGGSTVNATNDTVTCTGLSGTLKFSPPITKSESAGTTTTTIKATLSGCTSAPGLTVTSGSVTGTLSDTHAAEDGCTALAGSLSASGSLTTKWKTSPKLSSGNSVIAVNSVEGGVGGDGNATFDIPGSTPNGTPSGSFQGTDHGASDTTAAQSTVSAVSILGTCDGKKGLKSLSIESPASGAAVNLG